MAEHTPVDRREALGQEDAARKRRHIIRHNCQAVVELSIGYSVGAAQDWSSDTLRAKGRVLDLSMVGAALFTRDGFQTDQKAKVTITTRTGEKIKTDVVVRWVKSMPEKGGHAVGFEFVNMPQVSRQAITRFLKELEATLGL